MKKSWYYSWSNLILVWGGGVCMLVCVCVYIHAHTHTHTHTHISTNIQLTHHILLFLSVKQNTLLLLLELIDRTYNL